MNDAQSLISVTALVVSFAGLAVYVVAQLRDNRSATAFGNRVEMVQAEVSILRKKFAVCGYVLNTNIGVMVRAGMKALTVEDYESHLDERARAATGNPVELRNRLVDRFSLDELRSLAFDMNYNSDDFGDNINRRAYAERLLEQARRDDRVGELSRNALHIRPNLWDD